MHQSTGELECQGSRVVGFVGIWEGCSTRCRVVGRWEGASSRSFVALQQPIACTADAFLDLLPKLNDLIQKVLTELWLLVTAAAWSTARTAGFAWISRFFSGCRRGQRGAGCCCCWFRRSRLRCWLTRDFRLSRFFNLAGRSRAQFESVQDQKTR